MIVVAISNDSWTFAEIYVSQCSVASTPHGELRYMYLYVPDIHVDVEPLFPAVVVGYGAERLPKP